MRLLKLSMASNPSFSYTRMATALLSRQTGMPSALALASSSWFLLRGGAPALVHRIRTHKSHVLSWGSVSPEPEAPLCHHHAPPTPRTVYRESHSLQHGRTPKASLFTSRRARRTYPSRNSRRQFSMFLISVSSLPPWPVPLGKPSRAGSPSKGSPQSHPASGISLATRTPRWPVF